MMPRGWLLLLAYLVTGCASVHRVHLETGEGRPILYTPRTSTAPVELDDEAFEEVVQELAPAAPVSGHPREAALRLFEDSLPPRTWAPARGRLGLVSVEEPGRGRLRVLEEPDAEPELTSAYGRWCQRKHQQRDCLHLLEAGLTLDEEGKRTLAFRLALDSVWDETAEALEDLTDKDAMVAMLATTGAVYFGLWLLPEPVSKGVAATLTLGLIAYLGWDTVWSLIQGWRVLAEEVRVATTFSQLEKAGEQYGKVMGGNAARAFIMLAMAALGSTAQTLAAKLPTLPGSAQAALVGAEQGGFRLAAAGQVTSVAVAPGGVITIGLDPGAVAETAREPNTAAPAGVDKGGHEHHIATNKWWKSFNNGGPWSPRFQRLFDQAGMSLDDAANRVHVKGHKGPHPEEYHQEIYRRLRAAMADCSSLHQCRELMTDALGKLALEIKSPNTRLNALVTRN